MTPSSVPGSLLQVLLLTHSLCVCFALLWSRLGGRAGPRLTPWLSDWGHPSPDPLLLPPGITVMRKCHSLDPMQERPKGSFYRPVPPHPPRPGSLWQALASLNYSLIPSLASGFWEYSPVGVRFKLSDWIGFRSQSSSIPSLYLKENGYGACSYSSAPPISGHLSLSLFCWAIWRDGSKFFPLCWLGVRSILHSGRKIS